VKRTAERLRPDPLVLSAVRFTDFVSGSVNPSDKSLGYFQSSASADSSVAALCKATSLAVDY